MVMDTETSSEFVILFVCRANRIRSVIAEQLVASRLRQIGDGLRATSTPLTWSTRSAGIAARSGEQVHPRVSALLRRWDIDATGSRSHQITAEDVAEAGLILTAERAHRSSVVSLDPRAVHRTFTLRQFAHLVHAGHPIEYTRHGGEALGEHARSRRHLFAMMDPQDDDIADPLGGTDRELRSTGLAIAKSLAMFGVSPAPLEQDVRRSRWPLLRRH